MPSLIRVIAIILLIYFGIRLLGKLLAPRHKPTENTRRNRRDEARPDGDVRIEYTDKNKAKRTRKDSGEGEYVDFEELD